MNTANYKRHTLSVVVENAAGVLSQVSRLFSRKGYNIESLAVGTTDDPEVSRITIEVLCDDQQIEQITNQLRKQFTVYSVRLLPPDSSIRRELVLIKVKAESREVRNEVIQIANIFRASIIDVSTSTLTLAIIGEESKDNALEKLLEELEFWSWCAPAWWRWNGAEHPLVITRTTRKPASLYWAKTCYDRE